ncbi:TPA: hypothetical protein ACH3X1_005966 [Trebouxia sp. C0004]
MRRLLRPVIARKYISRWLSTVQVFVLRTRPKGKVCEPSANLCHVYVCRLRRRSIRDNSGCIGSDERPTGVHCHGCPASTTDKLCVVLIACQPKEQTDHA